MTLAIGALCPEGAVLLTDSIRGTSTYAGWTICLEDPKIAYFPRLRAGAIFSGEVCEPEVPEDAQGLVDVIDANCEAGRGLVVALGAGYDGSPEGFGVQLVSRPEPDQPARVIRGGTAIEVVGLGADWWAAQPPCDPPSSLEQLRATVVGIGRRFVDDAWSGQPISIPHETANGGVEWQPYVGGSLADWQCGRSPMPLVSYPLRMITFAATGIFLELLGALPLGIFAQPAAAPIAASCDAQKGVRYIL